MIFPAVKLHQLYSLNLYENFDVIFESLEMVDMNNLSEAIKSNDFDNVVVVPKLLSINTKDKTITIVGHKINNKTYMLNKAGNGDIYFLNYNCEKQNIVTGIEYLYHMHKNLV